MKTLACFVFTSILITGFFRGPGHLDDSSREHFLKITFKPVVNGQAIQFGSVYKNTFGEDYTITAFRFYIGHLSFSDNYGRKNANYHLFDAAIPASQTMEIPLGSSAPQQLTFQVGVDSIDNVSGAQDGVLDPAKGMFWTWNTGYVMAKLEGNSTRSNIPTGAFTYHIGGYKGTDLAIRKIKLDLSIELSEAIRTHKTTELIIEAEISKWFDAVHPLKISAKSFIHGPGPSAKLYADNYAAMFRISTNANP